MEARNEEVQGKQLEIQAAEEQMQRLEASIKESGAATDKVQKEYNALSEKVRRAGWVEGGGSRRSCDSNHIYTRQTASRPAWLSAVMTAGCAWLSPITVPLGKWMLPDSTRQSSCTMIWRSSCTKTAS